MRITKKQLRRIIREEKQKLFVETFRYEMEKIAFPRVMDTRKLFKIQNYLKMRDYAIADNGSILDKDGNEVSKQFVLRAVGGR